MIRDKTMADALAAYTGTVTPCPPGRPAMTRRRKHLPATPARQCFWLYDGRDLLAIVEQRADGWHVLMRGRGDIGTLPTRALAVSMVEARQANLAASPIAGERAADAQHVQAIRAHQLQAHAAREPLRRKQHAVPRRRGLIQGANQTSPDGEQAGRHRQSGEPVKTV